MSGRSQEEPHNNSDVTGLVEVLVGWLATLPKSQPVGAFFDLQLAGYKKIVQPVNHLNQLS